MPGLQVIGQWELCKGLAALLVSWEGPRRAARGLGESEDSRLGAAMRHAPGVRDLLSLNAEHAQRKAHGAQGI